MNGNKNVGESSNLFCCEKCNYYTVKKYNFDKHNLTSKHIKSISVNENVAKSSKSSKDDNEVHICDNCNKKYKDNNMVMKTSQSTSQVYNVSKKIAYTADKNIDVDDI